MGDPSDKAVLQRNLKNYALCKKFEGALNLGPGQRIWQKKKFFQSALISVILTHFEKNSRKFKFCIFLFQRQLLILKTNQSLQMLIIKCFIDDSINCTFICQRFEVISLG